MSRKPRVYYQGALYHVIVRGNNKEYIFKEAKWKEAYLDTLLRYKKYGYKLFCYCVMDNHAHMLIEVDRIELPKIMQGIQQVYTQKYNKTEKRTGHLFEQRYKAYLCNKDRYLLQLVRYIHQNPVRAGISNDLLYEWSSHKDYLDVQPSNLVDKDMVLGLFSEDRSTAIKMYLDVMNEKETIEIENTQIKEEEKPDLSTKATNKKTSIDKLIDEVAELEEIRVEEIKGKNRNKTYSDIRRSIVLLSEVYTDANNKAVAEKLNISQAMISKIKLAEKNNMQVEEIIKRYIRKRLINQA